MPEPHLRAADTDRAAVAAALGEHMSAGRITLAEYDERVTSAYAATTFGDLAALTADLPSTSGTPAPAPAPVPRTDGPHPGPHGCGRGYGFGDLPGTGYGAGYAWRSRGRHHSWHAWVRTSLIVLVIWLATSLGTGGLQYFWPIWVIGPWGAVLLATWITGDHRRPGERRLDV